ncbi:MAG: hypothetical protein CVV51_02160 [Spirochaetae bacterium HGW-Spirochaetae-7]|jgi:NRPS condensation-like uncharacterized protein|nr:MAG: hypothetical protein CVV51_02160 [Spirochaetae bacterium HGW-Spirochaetae-7]
MKKHPWYALDHAALIYPPLLSDRISAYYRIQATLDAPVDAGLLQAALDAVRPRFPYFHFELRRGFFWYFFERNRLANPVVQDSRFPMQQVPTKQRGGFLYRVRSDGDTIALEMCHILTDGYGALIFFRSLLAEYYRLQGTETPYDGTVFDPRGEPSPEEWDDAFSRYTSPGTPKPIRSQPAWHLPGLPLPVHTMRVTIGETSLQATLAKAKEYGSTLTIYLAAVYLAALQDVQDAERDQGTAPRHTIIRLQVPANLRRFFPATTLRNFSLPAMPDIDPRLGHYDFREILTRVKAILGLAFDPKELRRTITRNVMTTRHPFIRIIPLPFKDVIMRTLYRTYGENLYSSLSTNVGPVLLPGSYAGRVRRVDLLLPSTPGLKTVAGTVSHGDVLSISFGSAIKRNDLERAFFTRLVKDGLWVKVESNLSDEH